MKKKAYIGMTIDIFQQKSYEHLLKTVYPAEANSVETSIFKVGDVFRSQLIKWQVHKVQPFIPLLVLMRQKTTADGSCFGYLLDWEKINGNLSFLRTLSSCIMSGQKLNRVIEELTWSVFRETLSLDCRKKSVGIIEICLVIYEYTRRSVHVPKTSLQMTTVLKTITWIPGIIFRICFWHSIT